MRVDDIPAARRFLGENCHAKEDREVKSRGHIGRPVLCFPVNHCCWCKRRDCIRFLPGLAVEPQSEALGQCRIRHSLLGCGDADGRHFPPGWQLGRLALLCPARNGIGALRLFSGFQLLYTVVPRQCAARHWSVNFGNQPSSDEHRGVPRPAFRRQPVGALGRPVFRRIFPTQSLGPSRGRSALARFRWRTLISVAAFVSTHGWRKDEGAFPCLWNS